MIKIALDIDNTLYDTKRCERDITDTVFKHFPQEDKTNIFERIKFDGEIRNSVSTWFNPGYLIATAIDALKNIQQEFDIEYYICTARCVDDKYYNDLFQDTGLTFKDIFQGHDYPNKASACLRNDIDVLVDDGYMNLMFHCNLRRTNTRYTTKFVYYTGHTEDVRQIELQEELSDSTIVMSDWEQFPTIFKNLLG